MDHPLSVGDSGVFGWQCANQVLDEADVLLAIGCRFAEFGYSQQWSTPATWNLIHVDIDPNEIGKTYPPAVGIVGDAKSVLKDLLVALQDRVETQESPAREWNDNVQQLKTNWLVQLNRMVNESADGVHPGRFFRELREILPREARIFSEPTCTSQWALQVFDTYLPKTQFLPGGYAHLGWAFPAAMGAKLADPKAQVLAISGDWAFQYALAELGTALRENIPVTCVVFDDGAQLCNKQFQEGNFDGRVTWINQNNPDFRRLAGAFEMKYARIDNPEQIQPTMKKALDSGEPYLISVKIDPSIPGPATGKLSFRW